MEDEWIVRVEGKEYGPVDTDELREWRREGRLIPTNEVRHPGEVHWVHAGELLEVFGDEESPALTPGSQPLDEFVRTRTWREILAETFRVYRHGFARFMVLGLLISVPMFVLQWTFPRIPLPDLRSGSPPAVPMPTLPPITIAMVLVLLIVWPVSAAAFQFVADDMLRGRSSSIGAQVSTALRYWPRMLGAALLVYGSYFFWTYVPLQAMLAFSGSGNLLVAFLMILFIGGFMLYVIARLFINFLFWQQTVVLGEHSPLLALRESKELARSVPEAPRLERPLYRGAIAASIWLLLLLVLTFAVQVPFAAVRFMGIENPEEAMTLMRKMAESQTTDTLMLTADIATAVVNLLLRPLLAVVFVILYYDARARAGRTKSGGAAESIND